MKTRLIALVIICLSSHEGFSQLKGFGIGPYVETAWPQGAFSQRAGKAIGGGVSADVKLLSKFSATGSIGLLRFAKMSRPEVAYPPLTATPMRFGVKYRLPLIYLKMESGVAKLKDKKDPVILSPGVGIRLLGLDVQASYESWLQSKPTSFARLRVAYQF